MTFVYFKKYEYYFHSLWWLISVALKANGKKYISKKKKKIGLMEKKKKFLEQKYISSNKNTFHGSQN